MKILIISTYFPPENSIASHRPYSWAKYWTKMGHDVTVATTDKITTSTSLNLDTSLFSIISLPVPSIREYYFHIKRETNLKENDNSYGMERTNNSFTRRLFKNFIEKTGCFSCCRYPEMCDIWARNMLKLDELKNSEWDLVISTGWPYSVHIIGYELKKRKKTKKWIVDWRDLWTKNHMYKGLFIFRSYERLLEKKFHSTADLITTVSEGLKEVLQKITETQIEVIYNGYDKEDYQFLYKNERKLDTTFTVSYLGTIYKGFRDPEPLLLAVSELSREGKLSLGDFRMVFAGSKNTNISERINELNISAYYEYLGFLPREQALQLQYDSDAVLFLEHENPKIKGILTGKLFEYLVLAKEIWGVGTTENTSAGRLITNTNSGICFGHDVSKIKEYILQRIRNREFIAEKKLDEIERFDRKIQAEKILNILESLEVEKK